MVAGAIGFLAWSGSVQGDTPPDIRVEVERVLRAAERLAGAWSGAFNEGGSAAAEVTVGGELTAPDGTVETAELRLDLPALPVRPAGRPVLHPRSQGHRPEGPGAWATPNPELPHGNPRYELMVWEFPRIGFR